MQCVCNWRRAGYDSLQPRLFQFVPLWNIAILLRYTPRRVRCEEHGVRVEHIHWATGKIPLCNCFRLHLVQWARLRLETSGRTIPSVMGQGVRHYAIAPPTHLLSYPISNHTRQLSISVFFLPRAFLILMLCSEIRHVFPKENGALSVNRLIMDFMAYTYYLSVPSCLRRASRKPSTNGDSSSVDSGAPYAGSIARNTRGPLSESGQSGSRAITWKWTW